MKLNSAYAAGDKEGGPHQEDMALWRKMKFIQWYKELETGRKRERQCVTRAKDLDINEWHHSFVFVAAATVNSSTTPINTMCCPDSPIDLKAYGFPSSYLIEKWS